MPPKGYRGITVRNDVAELLLRAKTLFHKTQIQLLLEALSEYISRHYEYGSAVLSSSASDAVAVAWSAGIFEGLGVVYPHPSPAMKIAVHIMSPDETVLARLRDIWGGTLYKGKSGGATGGTAEPWAWGLRSEKAKRFLEAILPYMKGEKSKTVKYYLAQPSESREATATEELLNTVPTPARSEAQQPPEARDQPISGENGDN